MFHVVRNTLIVVALLVLSGSHGYTIDRYRVNVKAHHYPWMNTSTYDIDVYRTGLRRLNIGNIGEPVESQLRDTPIGGNFSQLWRLASASGRDTAEANLLNAQAELIRFQLQEAKKQSRQRNDSVADVAAALMFAYLNNVDFETAGTRYLRTGGDPKVLSAAFADITCKAQAREVKREPLSTVLNLNNAQTQRAYRTLRYYETNYKLTRAQAITKFLTLRRGLSPAEANSCLKRIRY